MALEARHLVTEAEFLALPETTDKIELIDGEVFVSPSPSLWHQEVLQRLVFALRTWSAGQRATVGLAPLDVRFGAERILQPDAFLLFERIARDHTGPLDSIPELCVEVLSSNRAHDRVTKRFIYAQAGVKELWAVEPSGMIERWHGDGLSRREEVTEKLTTPLLPGFSLSLRELFDDDP